MPEDPGLDFAELLKIAKQRHKHKAVIICSGCGRPCAQCRDGCTDHLPGLLSRDAA
jgi:hypothetical protein